MRDVFEQLRKGASWLLSAIALLGLFLTFGFVRAEFSFADCEGGKPDISLGGIVASAFGITACNVHSKAVAVMTTAAAVTEATPRKAIDTSTSQEATTSSNTVAGATDVATTAPELKIQAGSPYMFHGFYCEEVTCAGHWRGYNWASEKGVDDPHSCYHGRLSTPSMRSFSEGCEAFVDESTGAARLDENDRYNSDATDSTDHQ